MPSIENLEKIAKVFEIPVQELFINDSFLEEEKIRKRVKLLIDKLPFEKLRILYLIAMNL